MYRDAADICPNSACTLKAAGERLRSLQTRNMLPATTFPTSAVHSPLECIDEVAEVEHSLRDKRHGIDAVGTPPPHLLREAEISLCSPKRGLEARMSEAVRHEEIANYPPELEGNTNWQRAMSELGHVVPC